MKIGMILMGELLLVSLVAGPGFGQASAGDKAPEGKNSGPEVGETIPAFSLPDQNGKMRDLESLRGPNGLVVLFHRSADW